MLKKQSKIIVKINIIFRLIEWSDAKSTTFGDEVEIP